MPRTAIVIPVHNRCETTLECLRALAADGVFSWAEIYVIDDGSTDGTSVAVRTAFPTVRLLKGDGNLWWTGAVELGMRTAFADGAEYYVWLNDDTTPTASSCARLVETIRSTGAVVTGQCFIPPDGPVVYGGLRRRRVSLLLTSVTGNAPAAVDAACGNFVGIPRAVIDAVGFPDGKRLPHAFGDSDYTLRAKSAGFPVLVEPRALAHARPNALGNYASWLLSDVSVADVWRPLFQKRSYAYAPAHVRFLTRHFGVRGAIYWAWTVVKRLPISLIRLIVPRQWRLRIWAPRSEAWRTEQEVRAALARSTDAPPPST